MRPAASAAAASSATGPPLHGMTGTSTLSASRLAAILSPTVRITSLGGPRNPIPAAATFAAKSASSATKPHPGHTASAPASRRAASRRSAIEVGGGGVPGRAQAHGVVRVAHEGRVAIDRGVEGDALQVGPLQRAQRLHGADAAHGRLAAVDDGEAPDAGSGRQRGSSERPMPFRWRVIGSPPRCARCGYRQCSIRPSQPPGPVAAAGSAVRFDSPRRGGPVLREGQSAIHASRARRRPFTHQNVTWSQIDWLRDYPFKSAVVNGP